MEKIMTTNIENGLFDKKLKHISDVLGYLAAGLYSGSAFLYFAYDYHLARCVYLLMTVYFVGMSALMIFRMLNINSASSRFRNALLSSIQEAMHIDFSFVFYHGLLLVGLVIPFLMTSAGTLSQTFAVIVGLLEIIMLATAYTLHTSKKIEQP
jgi:hypothetical protein